MHSEENTPNEQPQGHTEQPAPGGAETHEAGVSSPTPGVSTTTQALIKLLRARDATGREKYGATLDRTDLTKSDWLQHLAEELLDGAGYALAAMRTPPSRSEASAPVGVEYLSRFYNKAGDFEYYRAEDVDALAQQPAAVDEAMVERASEALWEAQPSGHMLMAKAGYPIDWPSQPASIKRDYAKQARATLTAALAGQQQGDQA